VPPGKNILTLRLFSGTLEFSHTCTFLLRLWPRGIFLRPFFFPRPFRYFKGPLFLFLRLLPYCFLGATLPVSTSPDTGVTIALLVRRTQVITTRPHDFLESFPLFPSFYPQRPSTPSCLKLALFPPFFHSVKNMLSFHPTPLFAANFPFFLFPTDHSPCQWNNNPVHWFPKCLQAASPTPGSRFLACTYFRPRPLFLVSFRGCGLPPHRIQLARLLCLMRPPRSSSHLLEQVSPPPPF